jgi:DUF1680 family protein
MIARRAMTRQSATLPAIHRLLVHWKFRNQVLAISYPENLSSNAIRERPKVFYNHKTKTFVMYMHLDGPGYKLARVAIAVSKTVDGNYKYVRSFRPLGQESRDIGEFIDGDGRAYLIFESRPTHGFFIAKLSPDYMNVEKQMSFVPTPRKGGAIVHYQGMYYVVGSHLTGWRPNPNVYATAPSLSGPWTFTDIAPPEVNTYNSQSSMLLKVCGSKATTVIYVGDRWKPKELWDSRYIWMPVDVRNGKFSLPDPTPWSIPPKRIPKTAAEYNRHPLVHEPEPFSEPILFTRDELSLPIQPFALDAVRLNPGPLQDARDWNLAYVARLPNDRLLHNFRITAGLPSDAIPLGGWEAPKSELRGHFVGHYLSSVAMLYAATGDPAIKSKADALVAGIAECQAKLNSNGYVSAFPDELFKRLDRREEVWAPFYTLHKIMAGLLDMHTYAGNQEALGVLLRLAAWVDAWTANKPEDHMQDILKTEYGGMNDVLYHLAAVTGNDRWARTGDRFTKKIFFTPLAMRRDELKGLHANTHMPQVVSAARRYELSSDYRFGDVSSFFWETIAESRTYASGGSGNTEGWLTDANRLALEMKVSSHHQECCCAHNMMKLARHLYARTSDVKYIDYYERNLFNHRLGGIQPQTGLTTYFLSMSPGAWKTTCTEDQTFWCCTGTAVEDFAKLNDTIYYHDKDDLYVNLFVSSYLRWKYRGIQLEQKTSFPQSDRTVIAVHSSPAAKWTLHLRIPAWTSKLCQRQWPSNRCLRYTRQLSLDPASLEARRPRRARSTHAAASRAAPRRSHAAGLSLWATVLAGQFPLGQIDYDLLHNQGAEIQERPPMSVPALTAKGADPGSWIKPMPGEPLTFRTIGQAENVTLKPLNQSWERFAVYWTVS